MSTPAYAEHAYRERETHWQYSRACPLVAPGSSEEGAALDRIDQLRDEERAKIEDTAKTRHKRHERYWRKHV